MRQSSNFGGSQRLVMKYGDRPRESDSSSHRRKSLPQSTLSRGFQEGFVTTVESQLAVLGQAVTLWNTPKATLLELALFRRFFPNSSLTESYGESVASGVWVND